MKNLWMLTLLGCSLTAFGAAPEVYPVPQKMTLTGGEARFSAVKLSGTATADSDAVALLKTLVKVDDKAPYAIHLAQGESARVGLEPISGSYRLKVGTDEISISAYDAAGMFYAVQTLSQLITPSGIPCIEINDYPDIAFRGTVEGFYGQPWSHEARRSQFEFYGKYKLNTYIYGPKDDPFHGFSNRWREPYPPKEAEMIRDLAKVAHANKVNFVWAVHPGRDIKWTDADFKACIHKFELMYNLGIRSFGVFFDDIGGEGARGDKQVEFLNGLNREFIQKKPDVTPLVMCPTQYNKSWSDPKPGTYLDILGDRLDSSINIMWTGNTVCHDITLEGNQWVNKRIKRPAFIWWNFPVSDYVRDHLLLGRIYGLDQSEDAKASMSGFTSNPMDKPEASKIALFSIADYTWNIKAFNSEKSWRAGIVRLFPKCAAAMQTFANHNSDQGPNGHGYRREESVTVAPIMEKFLADYRKKGTYCKEDYALLLSEFKRIAKAPSQIRAEAGNPALLNETAPWLDAFEQLGIAGENTLKLMVSIDAADTAEGLVNADKAATALDAMRLLSETQNQNPYQRGVKTGSQVVTPFVTDLFKLAGARIYSEATGLPMLSVTPITSSKQTDGLDKMLDRDPSSYYYCREIQKVGDWYGLDLGSVQPVKTFDLTMGRWDGDHDIVHKGQLEVSANGNDWVPACAPTVGERVLLTNQTGSARYVRYRVLRAGKLDGSKNDVWTAIRNFAVNAAPLPSARSTLSNMKNLMVKIEKDGIAISPVHEVSEMAPGDNIELLFPEGIQKANVKDWKIDLDTPDYQWSRREWCNERGEWTTQESDAIMTGVRLVNSSQKMQPVKIKVFKLLLKDDRSADFKLALDGDLTTSVKLKDKSHFFKNEKAAGASSICLIGDLPDGKVTLHGTNGQSLTLSLDSDKLSKPVILKLGDPITGITVDPEDAELTLREIIWLK